MCSSLPFSAFVTTYYQSKIDSVVTPATLP